MGRKKKTSVVASLVTVAALIVVKLIRLALQVVSGLLAC